METDNTFYIKYCIKDMIDDLYIFPLIFTHDIYYQATSMILT